MTTEQLLADARKRLTVSRLGKSIMREMDADLIVIRRLVEALEAVTAERDRLKAATEKLTDLTGPNVVYAPDEEDEIAADQEDAYMQGAHHVLAYVRPVLSAALNEGKNDDQG